MDLTILGVIKNVYKLEDDGSITTNNQLIFRIVSIEKNYYLTSKYIITDNQEQLINFSGAIDYSNKKMGLTF